MTHMVISLGGPVAPEGEKIFEAAGVTSLATGPYPKKEEIVALLAEKQPDALVVRLVERIDEDIMKASAKLKVVAKHGAGTNDIDVAAAAALGIPVLAAVGANAHSVAEHALALMLCLVKDLRNQDAFVRGGGWEKKTYRGHELRGRALGLVGIGMIGRAFAAMVQPLGMSVVAYDPFAPAEAFGPHVAQCPDLDTLLATSDVVSLHCPLTAGTRGLIGSRELRSMRTEAILLNTARGELVDEPSLIAALTARTIAGAGLDTFSPEPPARDNPLWALPNLIVSPHVGGVTEEARREVSSMTCRNVVALLEGRDLHPRYFVR